MNRLSILIFVLFGGFSLAQEKSQGTNTDFVVTPEIMFGISADSNENYPSHDPQFQILVNLGWEHDNNPQEWAQRLKGPRTGLSLGYTNFGNNDSLGSAFTILPFIEFNIFRSERLKLLTGMGGSYFTKKYDPVTNPRNQGITTDITWSFRLFMNYEFLRRQRVDWRLGIGYFHHSNGHTRLPNQGVNSFLLSLSADIRNGDANRNIDFSDNLSSYERTVYKYLSLRAGLGSNVLSLGYNDVRGVYTVAGEYGWVLNNTYKLGGGLFYSFYQHYYDYINDNEFLVRPGAEFDEFADNPGWNASNFGLFVKAEFLINHFGLEFYLGYNVHKPMYKIDWRINEGWDNPPREFPPNWVYGEFDSKFRLKHALATRMGIKYYLIGTTKAPRHNVYLGFHIKTNGGQADYTDLSLGYTYKLN